MTIALPRLDRSRAAERGLTLADFLVPIRVGERLGTRVRHVVLDRGRRALRQPVRPDRTSRPQPVPFTGQTFGVLLVGGALGFRRGAGGAPALSRHRRRRRAGLRRGHVRARQAPSAASRRLSHRVRRGGGPRRPAGRARLGPAHRRGARDDGHRHGGDLRDRRAVAQGHARPDVGGRRRRRHDEVPDLGRGQARGRRRRSSRPRGGSSAAVRTTAEGPRRPTDASRPAAIGPRSASVGCSARSEAWRLDREAMLLLGAGPRALLLQIAHPAVAAGVDEHSDFRADPVAPPGRDAPQLPADHLRLHRRRAGRDPPPQRAPPRASAAGATTRATRSSRCGSTPRWSTRRSSRTTAGSARSAAEQAARFYEETLPIARAFGVPDATAAALTSTRSMRTSPSAWRRAAGSRWATRPASWPRPSSIRRSPGCWHGCRSTRGRTAGPCGRRSDSCRRRVRDAVRPALGPARRLVAAGSSPAGAPGTRSCRRASARCRRRSPRTGASSRAACAASLSRTSGSAARTASRGRPVSRRRAR